MAYPGLSLYKLMILYMLEKVSHPLSNNQIVEFLLDHNYTDYFNAQEAINDLLDDGSIFADSTVRTTMYSITEDGHLTVLTLENTLDIGIRTEILEYLKSHSYALRAESGIRADYTMTSTGEYAVHLTIIEQGTPLLDLTVNVMTKEEAEQICASFEEKNQLLYEMIMRTLLRE